MNFIESYSSVLFLAIPMLLIGIYIAYKENLPDGFEVPPLFSIFFLAIPMLVICGFAFYKLNKPVEMAPKEKFQELAEKHPCALYEWDAMRETLAKLYMGTSCERFSTLVRLFLLGRFSRLFFEDTNIPQN